MTVARDSFLLIERLSNQSRLLVHDLFPGGDRNVDRRGMDAEKGSESKGNNGKELNKCDRGRGFDCKKRNGRAGTKINCIYSIHWSYDVVIEMSLESYVIHLPWPCL